MKTSAQRISGDRGHDNGPYRRAARVCAAADEKGFLGFFRKKSAKVSALKAKYDKAEVNVERIAGELEKHQITLLKDVSMLDKMYEENLLYFKQLTMYTLRAKKA